MRTRTLSILCLTLALLLPLWSFVPKAMGAEPSEPRLILEKGINAVLKDLSDPALSTPNGRGIVLKRVENTISELFDFRELSARSVGPNWKTFTPDQQQRLVDNFTTLLRETYLEKFDAYNGEKVAYSGEVMNTKGNRAEIQTTIEIDNKSIPIAYRLIKKSTWAVYDVNIEGVSLVQNFRSQFQSVLLNGEIEELIGLVAQKAEETRAENKK